MKRYDWTTGYFVTQDDLDNSFLWSANGIQDTVKDLLDGQIGFISIPSVTFTSNTLTVDVLPLIGYDSNGKRVVIPSGTPAYTPSGLLASSSYKFYASYIVATTTGLPLDTNDDGYVFGHGTSLPSGALCICDFTTDPSSNIVSVSYTNSSVLNLVGTVNLNNAIGTLSYGKVNHTIQPVTSTTTLSSHTSSPYNTVISCDSTSAIVLTLPSAISLDPIPLTIVNINIGTVTVDGNGSETINGLASVIITAQYGYLVLLPVSGNWIIIGGL
jgi:hypothetical protein